MKTTDRRPAHLAMHFDTSKNQFETGKLGMWLFLASEVLFFGGLFAAYAVFRANNPEMFHYGQFFLDWRLGGLNTVVLITSSLTAAWSVRCAQTNNRSGLKLTLILTLLLASVFLVVKYFEYSHKIAGGVVWGEGYAPTAEILSELPQHVRDLPVPQFMGRFFSVYYLMTGLHGIHVLIGIGLYGWLLRRAARGDFSSQNFLAVDSVALYWHLVDLIWIFLFPLFYLID
jgi:cytochrome c oxidase subunit 3